MAMNTAPLVDLSGNFAGDLHGVLREAARNGPLATDEMTGATVVLRQADVETLAHDQRLPGIGLSLFDMMGISDGPLREWYGGLMFTTEGAYHRRIRSLVSRAFTPRSSRSPTCRRCRRIWPGWRLAWLRVVGRWLPWTTSVLPLTVRASADPGR